MLKKFFLLVLFFNINYLTASCCLPFYSRAEFGGSFSRCADICASSVIWDVTNEGYNNNLDSAPFAGFALGVNLNQWVSLGANYTYRGPLHYCKRQTPIADSDSQANTLGVARTRFFDFENNSFMLELFINRMGLASAYNWDVLCGLIAPYIGFGLGWSRNIVSNFHSVLDTNVTVGTFTTREIASAMTYKVTKDFSWDFAIGLEYNWNCLAVGLGYRYFDGGCFRSNNYIVDNLRGTFEEEVELPAWTGKFTSNEVVISLSLNF